MSLDRPGPRLQAKICASGPNWRISSQEGTTRRKIKRQRQSLFHLDGLQKIHPAKKFFEILTIIMRNVSKRTPKGSERPHLGWTLCAKFRPLYVFIDLMHSVELRAKFCTRDRES